MLKIKLSILNNTNDLDSYITMFMNYTFVMHTSPSKRKTVFYFLKQHYKNCWLANRKSSAFSI